MPGGEASLITLQRHSTALWTLCCHSRHMIYEGYLLLFCRMCKVMNYEETVHTTQRVDLVAVDVPLFIRWCRIARRWEGVALSLTTTVMSFFPQHSGIVAQSPSLLKEQIFLDCANFFRNSFWGFCRIAQNIDYSRTGWNQNMLTNFPAPSSNLMKN